MHDETVASTLGMYDGNAYQHLYESTQYDPLNQTEVITNLELTELQYFFYYVSCYRRHVQLVNL